VLQTGMIGMLMKKLVTFMAVTVISLSLVDAQGASRRKEQALDILFIGNSYTGNLGRMFTPWMAEARPGSHLQYRTQGGWTLARHLADPEVKEAINARSWDYVVLQEQSRIPTFSADTFSYEKHRASIRELVAWIRASGAKPVLYETWGRRDGDRGSPKRSPDFDAMQAHLTRSYADAAAEQGALLVPVGQVWQAVRKVDAQLGDALHAPDGSHASDKGSYLIAATFLRALVNVDAATLRQPSGITKAEADTIMQAVTKVLPGP
jgi:hypothetical protein